MLFVVRFGMWFVGIYRPLIHKGYNSSGSQLMFCLLIKRRAISFSETGIRYGSFFLRFLRDYSPKVNWSIYWNIQLAIPSPMMQTVHMARPVRVQLSLRKVGIGLSDGVMYIALTISR